MQIGKKMDNELHALENNKEKCNTCKFWQQIDTTNGYCDDLHNWHDETLFNSWCEKWEHKNENAS